jgi:hypothetical protein
MANYIPPTPPSLGSVDPGELYIDLQSRTTWLGVGPTEDPGGSSLISDLYGTLSYIDTNLVETKAYIDSGDALTIARNGTRAPTADTPWGSKKITALAQPTANQDAATKKYVDDTVAIGSQGAGYTEFTRGMVMMFSGSASLIGVGKLVGWYLCNGATYSIPAVPPATGNINYTVPDLRDRLVIASGGSLAVGAKNGLYGTTGAGTPHKHVIGNHALTAAQLPAHAHPVSITSGGESVTHTHTFSGSGSTNETGDHHHTTAMWGTNTNVDAPQKGDGTTTASLNTSTAGKHTHSVTISGTTAGRNVGHTHLVSGNTSNNTGGGATHTHTCDNETVHTHPTSMEVVPYYALAFIIYLPL